MTTQASMAGEQQVADTDIHSARRALMFSLNALDKANLAAAGAWAETAADTIRDAQLDADQIRKLVAPRDAPTAGDKAVGAITAAILVVSLFVWLIPGVTQRIAGLLQ